MIPIKRYYNVQKKRRNLYLLPVKQLPILTKQLGMTANSNELY